MKIKDYELGYSANAYLTHGVKEKKNNSTKMQKALQAIKGEVFGINPLKYQQLCSVWEALCLFRIHFWEMGV